MATEGDRKPLPPGLYDLPITRALASNLATMAPELQSIGELDPHSAPRLLARVLHPRIVQALAAVRAEPADKLARQLELANSLLELRRTEAPEGGVEPGDQLDSPGRRLLAVLSAATAPARPVAPARPSIPLSSSDLLVNGPHDLALGPEVRQEIASADRVDLLCSFLKWSGVRLVQDELRELCARRGPGALRVLTTAYMSTTEPRALELAQSASSSV